MTHQLVAHLFRHEAGRMASVLTCWLGFGRLSLAEDIVQDALLQALHTWPGQGIPDNPRAWLYKTAKNRALDVLRQEKRRQLVSDGLVDTLPDPDNTDMDRLFLDDELVDSQLRMLFACCRPDLAIEAQVAMYLKILGGLSVKEIADAFLTTPDTIEKRLYRAKEKIRSGGVRLDVPAGPQLLARLGTVLKSLYLLFNEGYTSQHSSRLIREDLCQEAMRLCLLVCQHPKTSQPSAQALMALMCFQASRFEARLANDQAVLLPDQDRSRWNQPLIDKGTDYLNRAATGNTLTDYHLEAAIAACHCLAPTYAETDWKAILAHYDLLVARQPSAIVRLNRLVALAQVAGPETALIDASNLTGLDNNHYYHTVLGELYELNRQPNVARQHYGRALALVSSPSERSLLLKKLAAV